MTSPRTPRRLLASVVALSLVAVATVAVAPGASAANTCRVKNLATNVTKHSLQGAIDAAGAGATLRVRGLCVGDSVIDKNLTLIGQRTPATGRPILDGDHAERVLWVISGKVSIRGLTIRRGAPSGLSGYSGGGILNAGRLTLTNVIVRGNEAADGAGISSTGRLVLNGTTQIAYNGGAVTGGGVFVSRAVGPSTLIMNDASAVHHNSAAFGAGIANEGSVTMNDTSSIRDNDGGLSENGGGIEIWWTAGLVAPTFTMTGQSRVKNNTAGAEGGGVVTWPACGLDPVVSGAGPARVTGNTPANRVTSPTC